MITGFIRAHNDGEWSVGFVGIVLVIGFLVAVIALFVVHPSDPNEPWGHRLACVIPLSLLVGVVLAVFSS
jgi:hypothetical protein